MKNVIEKLKESPLFNLSLSSKELFHSNFLYWVGNNYRREFGDIFSRYLKKRPEDVCINDIKREKANIDLSFSYSDGQEILIENKVKSIPYIGQLAKYSKTHTENKNYILLSLSEPIFFNSNKKLEIKGVTWHYLSYSELQEMLQKLSKKIQTRSEGKDDKYHIQIIDDYCEFIGGLIEINKHCVINEEDTFDFHSKDEDELYRDLIEIRLHDLYLKKKYALLAYEVYKALKILEEGKELETELTELSQPWNWSNETPVIYMGYGMTRSLGLMELKYLVAKNVELGIQIQGEHYRMVFEVKNADVKNDKKMKDLMESRLWFNLAKSFPEQDIYPKSGGFNKYGKIFFYKSVKLGTTLKIKDIITIILADVQSIESNYDEILEVVSR